jgi:hypothetical protein
MHPEVEGLAILISSEKKISMQSKYLKIYGMFTRKPLCVVSVSAKP